MCCVTTHHVIPQTSLRQHDPPDTPLVMIVDDNADSRDIYSTYFGHKGVRTVTASNGDDALTVARAVRPDVVVMDLTMPGTDGWQATRALKAEPATRDVIVIALTGHAFRGTEKTARDAGCDAYLIKPCLPDQLLDTVLAMWTTRREPRRESA
ncbi:MAG: response regulator [Candidatus Rokubacteria bacterium]|nr:response regulator [Candidatus Rokubacteria bacterium]